MKDKMMRFLQGRYGVDALSKCLLGVGLVAVILAAFFGGKAAGNILYILGWAAIIYCYFRIFSKNITKRYAENQKYLAKTYKLRSFFYKQKELMKQNEMKGLMFKMENDPRIIGSGADGSKHGLGWFIRKTSLDEFPQFWNVLKGDMSLVGTRPPTVDEWKQYEPYHRGRLAVKPGLTGMWQVSGRSDITDFEEVVKLDMEYVKNWNIGMDIKMLLKTVGVVLKGSGSK